jgi:hypothetical protein
MSSDDLRLLQGRLAQLRDAGAGPAGAGPSGAATAAAAAGPVPPGAEAGEGAGASSASFSGAGDDEVTAALNRRISQIASSTGEWGAAVDEAAMRRPLTGEVRGARVRRGWNVFGLACTAPSLAQAPGSFDESRRRATRSFPSRAPTPPAAAPHPSCGNPHRPKTRPSPPQNPPRPDSTPGGPAAADVEVRKAVRLQLRKALHTRHERAAPRAYLGGRGAPLGAAACALLPILPGGKQHRAERMG